MVGYRCIDSTSQAGEQGHNTPQFIQLIQPIYHPAYPSSLASINTAVSRKRKRVDNTGDIDEDEESHKHDERYGKHEAAEADNTHEEPNDAETGPENHGEVDHDTSLNQAINMDRNDVDKDANMEDSWIYNLSQDKVNRLGRDGDQSAPLNILPDTPRHLIPPTLVSGKALPSRSSRWRRHMELQLRAPRAVPLFQPAWPPERTQRYRCLRHSFVCRGHAACVLPCGRLPPRRAGETGTRRVLGATAPELAVPGGTILVPLNIDDLHWTLVAVTARPDGINVELYDSWPCATYAPEAEALAQLFVTGLLASAPPGHVWDQISVQSGMKDVGGQTNSKSRDPVYIHTPKQADTTQCGVAVALFALHLAAGMDLPPEAHFPVWRDVMAIVAQSQHLDADSPGPGTDRGPDPGLGSRDLPLLFIIKGIDADMTRDSVMVPTPDFWPVANPGAFV